MNNMPINRVALLHAINKWCAGVYNPLIAFPSKKGFPNVVYLYSDRSRDMLEQVSELMKNAQRDLQRPIMAFVEPLEYAPTTALTYRQWIAAGDTMKAIELKTNEQVFVLPVYDDNNDIIRYVSNDRAFAPSELKIFAQQEQ